MDNYEQLGTLYTSVIADILDGMGLLNQAIHHTIRPLQPELAMVGRARTVLYADVYQPHSDAQQMQIGVIESLNPGDVVVQSTGFSDRLVTWGELLSTAAQARGARGVVTDGLIRDTSRIMDLRFPAFSRGHHPTALRYRSIVVDRDVPVSCGGVQVRSGDLIFGDRDGVVVVPQDVEEDVIEQALQKVSGEDSTRQDLMDGASISEVYRRYGVL